MLGFKLPIVAGENIGVRVLWVEGDRVDQNLLSGERYSRGELEVHLALQTPPTCSIAQSLSPEIGSIEDVGIRCLKHKSEFNE